MTMFVTAAVLATLLLCAGAKPLGSLKAEDTAATAYFTEILESFSTVQRTGYPANNIAAVDPFKVDSFSVTVGALTITFAEGVLTGTSDYAISNVNASTDDQVNYQVTYVATTDTWAFSAIYLAVGTVDSEDISVLGEFVLRANNNQRTIKLTAAKSGDIYQDEKISEADALSGVTLTFINLPDDAQSIITANANSAQNLIWYQIASQYISAENTLFGRYLRLNPQTSD